MNRFACYAIALAVCAEVCSCACPRGALAANETQKLTANDAQPNDNFGYSVAISGNTAILGSYKDDDGGMDAGAAYLFRNPGSGTFAQIDKIIPNDPWTGDNFGSSVAISDNTAAIGALFEGGTGAAYIFKDNGAGDWQQVDKLTASDAASNDEFGYSIAVSGNTAVVGAWKDNSSRGAAYVFRDNGAGDWQQIAKLTANDGVNGNQFGSSVAISGNTILVGAPYNTNNSTAGNGAVYSYQEIGGIWGQFDKIIPMDPSQLKQFGTSVALSGTTAVIGAPGDSSAGTSSGAAYIVQRDPNFIWHQVDKFTASDATTLDQFGLTVGLTSNTAIVGAHQNSDGGVDSGSAYVFKNNGIGNWNQVGKLLASDDDAGDFFGYSVAVAGTTALVGAPLDNAAGIDAGAGYIFSIPTTFAGDYNHNGVVDTADYALWRDLNGQSGVGLVADGNGDGVVNQQDYQLWRENFGLTPPAGSGAVLAGAPEPSTIVLLFLMAPLLTPSFSRRR